MELTYDEITDILDINYFPLERTGYTLPPGIYKVSDIKKTLDLLLPDILTVNITNDDVRLKSNLKINQTLIYTEKSFFYTILGSTQSHFYPLHEVNGFYQLIPASFKSDKTINLTENDKVRLNCDFISGSIINGRREAIF